MTFTSWHWLLNIITCVLCPTPTDLFHTVMLMLNYAASRWKEVASGKHVQYDQRPDIFRLARSCMHVTVLASLYYIMSPTNITILNYVTY